MTVPIPTRAEEVQTKLALLRATMMEAGASAVRLRGSDWFAWVTAGGSNVVQLPPDGNQSTRSSRLDVFDTVQEC